MDAHEPDRASENPRPPSNLAESIDGSTRHSKDSHGRSRSHWGLSTAVHGVGFVAKKMVNNRITDSIWSLKRSGNSSTAHVPSDTSSSIPNAKRETLPHETISDQTSMPSLNLADEQTTKSHVSSKPTHEKQKKRKDVLDQSENSKPPDPLPSNRQQWPHLNTKDSKVIDDSEDLKPPDGSDDKDQSETSKHQDTSHVRPVNQHRWPIDHSGTSKPPTSSAIKPATQNLWPSTVGSNVLSKNTNPSEEVSKTTITPDRRMLQESLSEPTTESSQPSTPNKSHGLASRGVSPSPAPKGASLIPPSKGVRGVSLTPSTRGVSMTPATRGVSLTPRNVAPSVANRGPSPTLAATRGVPPSRGTSPNPTTRTINPLFEYHTPLQPSSPTESIDSNTLSISKETDSTPPTRWSSPTPSSRPTSPTQTLRGASPIPIPSERPTSPTQSTRGVSPTPSKHSDFADIGRRVMSRAKGVNPITSKPSGSTRHYISSSIISMFTSSRKEKIIAERKDAAQYLELLQNIQVQWQYLNASTEAAMDLQRVSAEKSLFDMWRTILELRDSVAAKKIDITLSILQLKLYAVLYRQMAYIDQWASIEREHESALSVTVNDLVTRSILLPIIGGVKVKADIKLLKFIVCSSVEVMQATISSIQSTLAKVGGTRHLASELVNVALHERALLDECEIFLASAAPLQIEECSLRSYLIQLNRTYHTE